FLASATSATALSYQWQRMPFGSNTWSNLSNGGAYNLVTTPAMTVTGPTVAMSGDQFRCVFTNSFGSVISNAASRTVINVTVSVPASQTVAAGQPATFSVIVSGLPEGPAPTYQWQRFPQNSATWLNLTNNANFGGVNTPTLTVSGTTAAMS